MNFGILARGGAVLLSGINPLTVGIVVIGVVVIYAIENTEEGEVCVDTDGCTIRWKNS